MRAEVLEGYRGGVEELDRQSGPDGGSGRGRGGGRGRGRGRGRVFPEHFLMLLRHTGGGAAAIKTSRACFGKDIFAFKYIAVIL